MREDSDPLEGKRILSHNATPCNSKWWKDEHRVENLER